MEDQSPEINTQYLQAVYKDPSHFRLVVDRMAKEMQDRTGCFETIAFSGQSGSAMAYPMAYLLGKHLSCVRKDDGSHFSEWRSGQVEGRIDVTTYCIVDDLIESGSTVKRIVDKMGRLPTCIFLYNGDRSISALQIILGEKYDNVDICTFREIY
jgi:adenine/guanine phosphoribosyltransferase-like PRPP-binding protein